MSKSVRQQLVLWGQLILGIIVDAMGFRMFLIPNNIVPGGFTGIAQLINHGTGWPVGTISLLLNIPLFLLSARRLGLSFGLRSLLATIGLSLAIDFLPFPSIIPPDTGERLLLASVFGGVLIGVGCGLILRSGTTTGGSDMLAKLVKERIPSVSVGSVMFMVDAAVILASGIVFDVVSAMFSLISTFISTYVIDMLLDGLNSARAYFIISSQSSAISDRIMTELERGATALSGRGMYSGSDKDVLLCVVSRMEAGRLRSIVTETDPNAFMISTNVHEALGKGFQPHAKPASKA